MTREDIKACCKKISPGYDEDSVCDFADNVQTLGFIDTSQGQNGSRGIVFSTNHMMLNTDGTLRIIFYRNITDVRIIESFEDTFSDELEIVCGGEEFRVCNCSLNKTELKSLLDKLCGGRIHGEETARIVPLPPKPSSTAIADTAASSEPAPQTPDISKEESAAVLPMKAPPLEIPLHETKQNEQSGNDVVQPREGKQNEPVRNDVTQREDRQSEPVRNEAAPREVRQSGSVRNEIPRREDRQNESLKNEIPQRDDRQAEQPGSKPLRADNDEDIIIERDIPVIFETVINRKSINQKPNDPPAKDDDLDNTEERLKIQNMTTEETMSFLAQSLSEINAPVFDEPEPEPVPEPVQRVKEPSPATIKDYNPPMPDVSQKPKGLTVEPVWGDIYIKASRNLRELCESSRLSMKQIEAELNDKLLESAKAFAEITADESRVPKVLIPKITELKAAAQNFDQYFQLGEDIAVRAMFFMLYQMLSYADRIVETPETKEGLNDFFRRFGPAGIMLSMLDMRV